MDKQIKSQKGPVFCDLHNVFRTYKMQLAVDSHTPINDCASAQRRAGIPAKLFLSYGLKIPRPCQKSVNIVKKDDVLCCLERC